MADRKQRPKSTGNGTGSILEYDDEFKVQVTVYDKYGKRKRLTKGGFRTRKEAELWRWKAIELLGDEKSVYNNVRELDEAVTGKKKIKQDKNADTVTVEELWQDLCDERARNIKRGLNKKNTKSLLKENISPGRWGHMAIFFADKQRVGHNGNKMVDCKPRMFPVLKKPFIQFDSDDVAEIYAACPVQSTEVHRDLRALCNMMALYYNKTYGVKHNPWDTELIGIAPRGTEIIKKITPLPDKIVDDVCWRWAHDNDFEKLARSDQVAIMLILTLCYSGMRVSECIHVDPKNVDFRTHPTDDKLSVRNIYNAGVKTATSKLLPITWLCDIDNIIVRAFLGPEGNIFSAYSYSGLTYLIQHLCRHVADMDPVFAQDYEKNRDLYDNIHLHQCRHWAAVHICQTVGEGGIGAAQQFLRHSSSKVTQDVYLWLDEQKTRALIYGASDIDNKAFSMQIRNLQLSDDTGRRKGKHNKYKSK